VLCARRRRPNPCDRTPGLDELRVRDTARQVLALCPARAGVADPQSACSEVVQSGRVRALAWTLAHRVKREAAHINSPDLKA